MDALKRKSLNKEKKKKRIRSKISGTPEKPRVSVYKSLKFLYIQAIDDKNMKTVCSSSTQSQKSASGKKSAKNVNDAHKVGKELGEKLKGLGIETIIFDRNSYRYHGKIKSLADGIREAGLLF